MTDGVETKRLRGVGKGSRFFVLGKDRWEQLWKVPTVSRMNLVSTYLVLLAGTGSDHQLTKWSAKACEEHVGIGKPRAKRAIEELISANMISRADGATMLSPQYRFPPLPLDDQEPIFLPVQLVTGLASETPVLRRVRETGDAMALRMLIDLYGLVQVDATNGVPIRALRQSEGDGPAARKLCEMGVHAIWAVTAGTYQNASGDWAVLHREKTKSKEGAWDLFWERVGLLKKIGALWYEPWLFDGTDVEAEPLMPLDLGVLYGSGVRDEIAELTRCIHEAATTMISEERSYLLDRYEAALLVPLATHRQAPAIRGVARLTVEADTPGSRRAYGSRRRLIERNLQAFKSVLSDALEGRFDRPMQLASAERL
jgi:hypothetical protein